MPFDPADVQAIDAQASVLMKRGIGLLTDAQPEAVSEALGCFDRALELRSRLPIDDVPVLRYGLAACWLNRADALMRLGDAAQIADALRAFDDGMLRAGIRSVNAARLSVVETLATSRPRQRVADRVSRMTFVYATGGKFFGNYWCP
jgi:hypothetical protein